MKHGCTCLIRTARAYVKLENDIAFALQDESLPHFSRYVFIREAGTGVYHNIESIIPTLEPLERTLLLTLLFKFNNGRIVSIPANFAARSLLSQPNYNIESRLLEYALESQGIALTVATEADWEIDFVEFHGRNGKLPNLWGQESAATIMDYWHSEYASPTQLLSYRVPSVRLCSTASLSDADFISTEWDSVIDCFVRAEDREYRPDGDLVRGFHGVDSVSGASPLKELCAHDRTIRIFFVNYRGMALVGGAYRKGNGPDDRRLQTRAANRAITHIRNYVNNIT